MSEDQEQEQKHDDSNSSSNKDSNNENNHDDSDSNEDTSDKFINTSITLQDLRATDAAWRPEFRIARTHWHNLIASQISYFADKCYFDSKEPPPSSSSSSSSLPANETIAEFTARFLAHPTGEAYSWSLDFNARNFRALAYQGFITTSIELKVGGGAPPIQVLLPWIAQNRVSYDM
jgi:hypothetical protein